MPVPSSINDLSTTAASNSPAGSESPALIDDYLRAFAAFIAALRDGKVNLSGSYADPSWIASLSGGKLTAGTVPTAALADSSVTTAKLGNASVTIAKINATGTPSSTNMLRGDGVWAPLVGATGGGTDAVFYENGQTVTANYTIPTGKNAMCAGPISVNTGVTLTVSDGSTLVIV